MKAKYWIISLLGLAAVVAGFILARMGVGSAPLPYVLLGVGCGAFGWGAGELLRQWAVRADPGLEKQIRIEQADERNQLVANKAKARAYDASVYIYSALMLCFALMQVRLSAVLLLVGGYLLTTGIYVYFQIRYNKEM